jgi:hypothetical protein
MRKKFSLGNIVKVGKIVKEAGKKIKGSMEKNPAVRKGIAEAKKDMKKKGFIGLKAKKIPRDLSYMKGYLD